jgi:sporulation protein YlmC with PRC-barrel domain
MYWPDRGHKDFRQAEVMSPDGRLNLEDELVGRSVFLNRTSTRLGKISDALVNPTKGTVIALSFRTADDQERWLAAGDFCIGPYAVLASENDSCDQKDFPQCQPVAAYACRELIGAKVVTDEGKLLGHVSEVQISAEDSKVFYRVVHSRIEQILSGGFLMAGDVPRAYFRAGLRLIVPANLEDSQTHRAPIGLPGFNFGTAQTLQIARDFISRYGVVSLFVIQTMLILWLLFA